MSAGLPRRMPDDIDVGVTPGEQAVEIVERAAGCDGACYGAEVMCIEPRTEERDKNWAFVGEGRGGYNQVQQYNFVGEGGGAWDKSESVEVTGWRVKPMWLGCILCATAIAAIGVGLSMSKHGLLDDYMVYSQNDVFVYDCAKDSVPSWGYPKKLYCCKKFSKGCDENSPQPVPLAKTTAGQPVAKPPPPPPQPKVAGQPPVAYDCNEGFDKWQWGWPVPKKQWCCQREQKGCSPPGKPAPGAKPAPAVQPAPASKPVPAGKPPPPPAVPGAKPGDAPANVLPYQCAEGYAQWQQQWTIGKRAWCCKHEGKACPEGYHAKPTTSAPFDCFVGFANWQAGWAADKKLWCCKSVGKACTGPAPATA